MGIVFNKKIGFGYNKPAQCHKLISRQRAIKGLTPRSELVLKNLGLKLKKSTRE